LALFALLVGLIPFAPSVGWFNRTSAVVSIGISTAVLLSGWFAIRSPILRRLIVSLVRRIDRVRFYQFSRRLESILARIAETTRTSYITIILTMGIWALAILTNQVLFLALHWSLPWTAAPFLLITIHLSRLINISPGQVGIFQYVTILTLEAYGVDRGEAFLASLLLHLTVVGVPIVWSIWFLRDEGAWWTSRLKVLVAKLNRTKSSSNDVTPSGRPIE